MRLILHKFIHRYYYWFVGLYVVITLLISIISIEFIPGLRFFTNVSGSMSPAISKGSLLLTQKNVDYNIGDIISFYALSNGKAETITHRIVRHGGNVYVTKGDANIAVDETIVVPRLIIGKVILVMPYIGYVLQFLKRGPGLAMFILFPALCIIATELNKIRIGFKRKS